MKALVYTDTLELQYRDEAEPEVADGEVLVEIEAVGICGSDMHAYHGLDSRRVPPLILGHEAVGIVQSGDSKGQRVVLNPLITCGHCDHCQGGRSNLCAQRELIGMRRAGAFAEYISIPQRNLLDMPQDMDPVAASLTEPAATSLHAIYLAEKIMHRPLSECTALVKAGGIISHVGLQDNEPGLDTRRITLEEITFLGNYTYSVIDLRAAIDLLYSGALGSLDWVDIRSLSEGAAAFKDIHEHQAASPKIVLKP